MNAKTLSPADADLHEVEMSVRRKQQAPLAAELRAISASDLRKEAAMAAMFPEMLDAIKALSVAFDISFHESTKPGEPGFLVGAILIDRIDNLIHRAMDIGDPLKELK